VDVLEMNDLDLAIKAVKMAGAKLMGLYNSEYNKSVKEDNTTVTDADFVSEKVILDILGDRYPILSEETVNDSSRLSSSKVWVVDPLDGTNDFIQKTGDFVIMIGLLVDKEPYMGVVYRPTANEMYVAEKGNGAFKISDGVKERINVSSGRNVVVSKNPLKEIETALLEIFSDVKKRGSVGLKFTLISEGYADAFFNGSNRPKQWDTCAAQIIVEEAGGKVSDMFGEKLVYGEQINHLRGVLVTNGKIHEEVLRNYKKLVSKDI
jgi:3'(2'), 5'-bisphosphate nucleotidase